MAAKKQSRDFETIAADVPENWAERRFLLSIPQIMTISGRSYWTILGMVKSGALRPIDESKPFRFTPSEVLRVFFPDKSSPEPRALDRSVTTERKSKTNGHKTKPVKEVLWR